MRVGERSPWPAPVRPSTSSSIMRPAMKAIISLRRSASEPFSMSSLRAILSMVMGFGFPSVRVGNPNQPESDHDRPPPRAGAVDGSSYVGLNPPTAPTAVLHHYRGHQPTAREALTTAPLRPPSGAGL